MKELLDKVYKEVQELENNAGNDKNYKALEDIDSIKTGLKFLNKDLNK